MNTIRIEDVSPKDPVSDGDYVIFTLDNGLTLEVLKTQLRLYQSLTLTKNTMDDPIYERYELHVHVGDQTIVTFEFVYCDSDVPIRWFRILQSM